MTEVYCYDKQLIKDFIRYASDVHKCAIVCFPDEFAANSYVNYKFIDTVALVNAFIESKDDEIIGKYDQ